MVRIRVCDAEDLASGEARRFDLEGQRVALVRVFDAFYAIGDRCTHEDVSLAEGQLVDVEELEIECPKHGSRFSLVTGDVRSLPAIRPEPVYAVECDGSDVFVTLEPTP